MGSIVKVMPGRGCLLFLGDQNEVFAVLLEGCSQCRDHSIHGQQKADDIQHGLDGMTNVTSLAPGFDLFYA